MIQQLHFWVYTQRMSKRYMHYHTYYSIIHSSQDRMIDWSIIYLSIYVCIYLSSIIHEKEEKPSIFDHMENPWGHYAKWNKSRKYCMISLKCGIQKSQTHKNRVKC